MRVDSKRKKELTNWKTSQKKFIHSIRFIPSFVFPFAFSLNVYVPVNAYRNEQEEEDGRTKEENKRQM